MFLNKSLKHSNILVLEFLFLLFLANFNFFSQNSFNIAYNLTFLHPSHFSTTFSLVLGLIFYYFWPIAPFSFNFLSISSLVA